jgi:superfamily II DNA or RNA helicase
MQALHRRPELGFLGNWLHVPKGQVNVDALKSALTFRFVDNYSEEKVRIAHLWDETEHHLLVPRCLWPLSMLQFPVVDTRPRIYERTHIVSNIKLDHRRQNGVLVPTKGDLQQRALAAVLAADSGILQLGCVSGDTILSLNRGGKGFKCTIRDAWRRLNEEGRYAWDQTIPTQIRSLQESWVNLQPIIGIIKRPYEMYTREIVLEDGKTLRLTDDHEVLTTEGYKSRITGLKVGDAVITDGQAPRGKGSPKKIYRRLAWYDSHPFAHKNGTRKGRRRSGLTQRITLEEHRAVAEATLNHLSLREFRERCRKGDLGGLVFIDPSIYHVHHKDGDHTNNKPDNLEVLLVAHHMAMHSEGARSIGRGYPIPVRIAKIGGRKREEVYDIACPAPHNNFVANGMVIHNCGVGKTIIALELIARLGGPALIVVDNTTLLEQWLQAIDQCLVVPGGIGRLQADICDWRGRGIVLATYQTLAARSADLEEGFSDYFMIAVYDEAHHLSAVTFAKGAPIIRGMRLALTATPKRDDGTNVIYDNHIGPVIFKDVTHAIKPRIVFKATGMDVNGVKQVHDKDGHVHVSKLGTYFGSWLPRLQMVLNDVDEAAKAGRKILVLSNTVDEAVNLCALWTQRNWHDPAGTLYSDIPLPKGLGQTGAPLTEIERELIEAMNDQAEQAMTVPLPDHVLPALQKRAEECKRLIETDDKRKGLIREYRKRQKDYLSWLMGNLHSAGLMIYKIPAQQRMEYLRTKQIVFAITKYGREGLDDEYLDTVLVSIPFSSRNLLQQLMGRPTRQKPGKKKPLIVFYIDNVGQLIGMSKKLQHHLDYWPVEESGPFEYEIHGQGARSTKHEPLWSSPERTP